MKYAPIILILLLAACTSTAQTNVQTVRGNSQSATIQINGLGKDISLSALPENSDLLFFGEIGDRSSVVYTVQSANESSIGLSNNPQVLSENNQWMLQASRDLPSNLILDIADGSLNASLAETQLMQFDLVSSNSTVDIQFPARPLQVALDTTDSTVSLIIPTGAFIFLERLLNQGGFMTISIGDGVSFEGNINIGAGGLTLKIPQSTGVQILVERVENSEISLPGISRIAAEATSYSTINFGTATARLILHAALDGAAIRIVQE
jgi:hypothetical protein